MRELKFRLLLDDKIVGYEKHHKKDVHGVILLDISYFVDRDCIEPLTTAPYHDEKHQFLDCLDKEGVEICEDDVLEVVIEHIDRPSFLDKVRVVWGDSWYRAAFGLVKKCCNHDQCVQSQGRMGSQYTRHDFDPIIIKQCKVIGRITEYPELLEA